MPNWKILSQYPCGCQVRQVHIPQGERYFIEYCPKHKAANDMYEALKTLSNYPAESVKQIANTTLAKAEGKGS